MFGFGGWEGCQRFGPHRLYILAKSLQLPQNLPEIRISHLNFACSATLLENFIRVSKSTRDFHFFVSICFHFDYEGSQSWSGFGGGLYRLESRAMVVVVVFLTESDISRASSTVAVEKGVRNLDNLFWLEF